MAPPAKKAKKRECRKSIVWKYFREPNDPNTASIACPNCKRMISFSGSTSALKYHLQHVHMEDYQKLLKEEDESTYDVEPSVTVDRANQLLGRALAVGIVPFRFVDNTYFRRFIECVQKLKHPFEMPSPSKIKRSIEELSGAHEKKVKTELNGVKKHTIITDGYSELRRGFHFYSLHVSYIDENFNRKTVFCGIQGTRGGDSVSIGVALCELMTKFGIQFSACSALASDGASPLVLLADTHDLDRVHCGCHVLDLIISEFSKIREVKNIEMRVSNFASHLARNKLDKSNLKSMSISKDITSELPLPLPATRWAGLHILLDRYLAHYNSAKDLAELQRFLVKRDEIQKIEDIRNILAPVHSGIKRLERDSSFASETIPILRFILKSIRTKSSKFSKKLEDIVMKRLHDSLENKRLLCTMVLDHRYAFVDEWIEPKSWSHVEYELEKYVEEEYEDLNFNSSSSQSDDDYRDIDQFLQSSVTRKEKTDKLEHELIRYKALLTTNRPNFDDPLEFWRGNKLNFPKLAIIAKEFFSTPASSALSERLFSRCTDVLRQTKRSRIKLETINEILTVTELSRTEMMQEEPVIPGTGKSTAISNPEEESSDEEDDHLDSELDDEEMNSRFPIDED